MTMGYGTQAIEKAPSQIEGRLRDLECMSKELQVLADDFGIRLGVVLSPSMKGESGSAQAVPKPVIAPLAERLDEIHAQLVNSASRMRDVLARLAI